MSIYSTRDLTEDEAVSAIAERIIGRYMQDAWYDEVTSGGPLPTRREMLAQILFALTDGNIRDPWNDNNYRICDNPDNSHL